MFLTAAAVLSAVLLSLGGLVAGQTIVVGEKTVGEHCPAVQDFLGVAELYGTCCLTCLVAVDKSTTAPAAEIVASLSSNATADLFPAETIQLTDAVLANLTSLQLTNVSIFAFLGASNEAAVAKLAASPCKTCEGDALWPSASGWNLFDTLLGSALIKTVPFGAVCYNDFGNSDPAKCATITNNWQNNSYIQCVILEHSSALPDPS